MTKFFAKNFREPYVTRPSKNVIQFNFTEMDNIEAKYNKLMNTEEHDWSTRIILDRYKTSTKRVVFEEISSKEKTLVDSSGSQFEQQIINSRMF